MFKVLFVIKLIIESHSKLVKGRCFGLVTNPTYNLTVSGFDEWEMRLKINFLTNRIVRER